jgi:FtsP/CotA-like multicopper oxidase with cupredoxin domain
VLVVSDVTFSAGRVAEVSRAERMHGRVGETVLVNGGPAPTLTAPAGSVHRLLLVNACVSRYLDLDLGGAQLLVRGLDGGRSREPQPRERVLLAPGNRADLEVEVPATGAVLTARAHDRGSVERGMGARRATVEMDATLLTFRVDATAPEPPAPGRPSDGVPPRDLRAADVARRRSLDLSMGMGAGGMGFLIDGRSFDAGRIDQQVSLGAVEEWTVRNATAMSHPFHLHVWPMQLLSSGGALVPGVELRDVVDVPPRGEVVVRIAFDRFPGTTVYHCHVLDHEDLGMMGTIRVG